MKRGFTTEPSTVFVFDQVEIDEALFELRIHGIRVSLQRRAFDLLVYLVKHRDRVVTSSELLDTVWSGARVCENAIAQAVASLRKTFAEAGLDDVVHTARGRGYRFMRDVEVHEPPARSEVRALSPRPDLVVVLVEGAPPGTLEDLVTFLRERVGREPSIVPVDSDDLEKTKLFRALVA